MKTVIFIVFLMFTASTIKANNTHSDVTDILNFIKKHSPPTPVNKISSNGDFSNYDKTKIIQINNNLLQLDYEGFTVWLNCKTRGAVKFRYIAQRDNGDFKRYKKFHMDWDIPKHCQQTSFRSYGKGYDRGHLVPANHLDYSKAAIKQSNFMTNILPQAAKMNRGAWLLTEEITECYRDIDDLLIIGGVIWGDNPEDDHFLKTHGIKTPDAYWKVIIRGTGQDERVIAWIVPNDQVAKRKMLDHYLVTVNEIEQATGEQIAVADYAKDEKPERSWIIPRGCNKG